MTRTMTRAQLRALTADFKTRREGRWWVLSRDPETQATVLEPVEVVPNINPTETDNVTHGRIQES